MPLETSHPAKSPGDLSIRVRNLQFRFDDATRSR